MRIGFFTDSYLPAIHGVTVSIESFRKCLETEGHFVYIYAPYMPGCKSKEENVFRFRSLKVFNKAQLYLAFPFLPKNFSQKLTKLPLDIVHAHSPFTLGLLAKFIARHQKIPLVYTHHTHYPEYARFYLKEEVLFPYLAQVISAWYSNMADLVISPSEKMKKLLLDYGVKKPISVLPTGIDLNIFKKSLENRVKFRKKLGIASDAKILLFVGRISREKNLEFLIKAFKEVLKKAGQPTILLMVGIGPHLEELRRLGDNLKISRFINFTGVISHQKISEFFQGSDVFVFSSLSETHSIVILEAIACGLPVVALKDEAFQGMIFNNKNGFLVAADSSPALFAKKILELLKNSSLYEKFSSASCKIASDFSEENQTKKLLQIYKELKHY